MLCFLVREKKGVDAVGEFDASTRSLIVKKGSRVSPNIAYSEKFRGAKTIERYRLENVKDGVLIRDVPFKSPSTAANFVTGCSTNGLTAWKTAEGEQIRDLLAALS